MDPITSSPNRSTAPPFYPIEEITFVKPVRRDTYFETYVFEDDSTEILKLRLIFPLREAPKEKFYLYDAFCELLTAGTKQFSSKEIAEAFDFYGAVFSVSFQEVYFEVVLTCLEKHFSSLVPLLSEILSHPTFPQKEIDIYKKVAIESLKKNREKTSFLAGTALSKFVYPDNILGYCDDFEDINNINRTGLQVLYSQCFTSLKPKILLSGNCGKLLPDALHVVLKNFEKNHVSNFLPFTPAPDVFSEQLSIQKEHSNQSALALGYKTIPRADEDYIHLMFTHVFFGGYFGSRLMQNIREDKGLTYGIYSSIKNRCSTSSLFSIRAEVNIDSVELCLNEIKNEIERMKSTLADDSEIEMVKNYVLGNLGSSLENIFSHERVFLNLLTQSLDYDYFDRYFSLIKQMDATAVQHTAKKYLDYDKLNIVYTKN